MKMFLEKFSKEKKKKKKEKRKRKQTSISVLNPPKSFVLYASSFITLTAKFPFPLYTTPNPPSPMMLKVANLWIEFREQKQKRKSKFGRWMKNRMIWVLICDDKTEQLKWIKMNNETKLQLFSDILKMFVCEVSWWKVLERKRAAHHKKKWREKKQCCF